MHYYHAQGPQDGGEQHITTEDQRTGQRATLCMDRSARSALVLHAATKEQIDHLADLALGVKADVVRVMVDAEPAREEISRLLQEGWTPVDVIVLERRAAQ